MKTKKLHTQNDDGSWDLIELEILGEEDGILQFGKELSREYAGFKNGASDTYSTNTNTNTNTTQSDGFFRSIQTQLDEIKQNIDYLLQILGCYADAFLKLKGVIEKLHDVKIE